MTTRGGGALGAKDGANFRLGSQLDETGLLAAARPVLTSYARPGNARELENICERMAAFFSQWEDKEKIAIDELHHNCPELYRPNAGQAGQGGPRQPRERARTVLGTMRRQSPGGDPSPPRQPATLCRWLREADATAAAIPP